MTIFSRPLLLFLEAFILRKAHLCLPETTLNLYALENGGTPGWIFLGKFFCRHGAAFVCVLHLLSICVNYYKVVVVFKKESYLWEKCAFRRMKNQ